MQTVIELVARRPCFLIVVCCSTRNDLDSLCSPLPFVFCSALSQTHFLPRNLHALQCFPNSLLFPPFPFPTCQYSDLGEDERAFILKKFRQDERSHMIIVTDACLPLLASGEFPLNAHLLINYELPAKKETYGRCLATSNYQDEIPILIREHREQYLRNCIEISRYCADGIVINMVVGGEVVTLKSIEESSTIVMQEMPMQILDFMKTILLLAFVNG
ncbi:ATP-dependent RNA helicase FAL1 [Glycine soja]